MLPEAKLEPFLVDIPTMCQSTKAMSQAAWYPLVLEYEKEYYNIKSSTVVHHVKCFAFEGFHRFECLDKSYMHEKFLKENMFRNIFNTSKVYNLRSVLDMVTNLRANKFEPFKCPI